MRRHAWRVPRLAAVALLCAAASEARADSVFGIRGMGILGRPVSARAMSMGGAFALFDGASVVNPASLLQWRGPAGWALGVGSRRVFTDGAVDATLTATRFPVFGFAATIGRRAAVGVAMTDYLDRTWSVETTMDTLLRDSAVTFSDVSRSEGGVSDLRVAGAYQVRQGLLVGVGLHALLGSTRLSVRREFSDSAYSAFGDVSVTDFSGFAFSAGALLRLGGRFAASASVRAGTSIEASAEGGDRATVALPLEMSAGALYVPVAGAVLTVEAGRRGWARAADDLAAAGEPRSRSVWNVSAGAELETLRVGGQRVPLRLGWRWRQLPFPVDGDDLDETAISGGLGLALAGGRATVDLGIETGRREAGAARESFTSAFVGVTVRP